MQAVERVISSKDWITGIILLSFFILTCLKFLDQNRLKGYFLLFVNKGFIELESFEKSSFFSAFNLLFSAFSFLTVSLLLLTVADFYGLMTLIPFHFLILFSGLFFFQVFQNLIQTTMISLFSLKQPVIYILLMSQRGYMFSMAIFAFVLNILFSFTDLSREYLVYATLFLLLMGILFFINLNKKLIINKLFYFILYLCAFKLAPLLVLFKLII